MSFRHFEERIQKSEYSPIVLYLNIAWPDYVFPFTTLMQ